MTVDGKLKQINLMGSPILLSSGMAYHVVSGKFHKNAFYMRQFSDLGPAGAAAGFTPDVCLPSLMLVQSIAIDNKALTGKINGLDDNKVIFTGGADFSTFKLVAVILTGGANGDGSYPQKVIEAFRQHSLANSTKPLAASWGSYNFKVYIESVSLRAENIKLGTITVELGGTIAPLQNKH